MDVKIHFCDSAIGELRGVQYVESAVIPSAAGRGALARIATFANDPPYYILVRNGGKGLQCVKERTITGTPAATHWLEIHLCIKAIENTQNVLRPFLINEVNGAFSIELRVARIKPSPDFISRIVLLETPHYIM